MPVKATIAPHISGPAILVRLKAIRSNDIARGSMRRLTMFGMSANLAVQSSASEPPCMIPAICMCHACMLLVIMSIATASMAIEVAMEPIISRVLRLIRSANMPPMNDVMIDAAAMEPASTASGTVESVISVMRYV